MNTLLPLTLQTLTQIADKQEVDLSTLITLLQLFATQGRIENNTLISLLGLPKTHFGRILKALSPLLAPPSPYVVLRDEYIPDVLALIGSIHMSPTPELTHKVQTIIQESVEKRPEPNRAYDQFYATNDSVAKRAFHLLSRGQLLHKHILFLGDDDHTSLAVSALITDSHISVIDIDKRILGSIRYLASTHQWNIQTIAHDLRHKLPVELLHSFDLVFTDPPYTPDGISLFLTRAIQAVKKAPTSRIFFCYGNSDRARERELQIQSIVTSHGLLIHEKLSGFNLYDGAESIGGRSSLYECALTPLTTVQSVQTQRMYTNFPQNDSREKILV